MTTTKPPSGKTSLEDVALPRLGPAGMLRWAWRQLTSMKTALQLLLLLAVAAVPGSLFPQRPANPAVVTQYIQDNPGTGPWLDRFQLFDVYSSVWFSAIYLLLFISLIGCVIPRAVQHWKALRSQPPRTPRRLSRLPEYGTMTVAAGTALTPDRAIEDAARILRQRGYRVQLGDTGTDLPSVAAERGYLKEAGNLVFHTAMIGVLVSIAVGGMFGYRGQKLIIEGEGFTNAEPGYDSFFPGTSFNPGALVPFSLTLNNFDVTFDRNPASYGNPIDFTADMTVQDSPSDAPRQETLRVNEPIGFGGTNVYLIGNGYAPEITVRDGEGNIALQGPVASLPTDATYNSTIVIKAPDARPDQLGFVGFFLPTAMVDENGVAFGSDPDPYNPQLNLNSYTGDLGLDDGNPVSVYQLDTTELTQLNGRDLPDGGIVLGAYQTYELPDGKGSITFEGLKRYVALDIVYDPGKAGALVFTTLALLGLIITLTTARRRVWIRAGQHEDGRTMIEYGLLARGEDHSLAKEAIRIGSALTAHWNKANDQNRQATP
ncbi:cytochrome c biogenesis protein ResB [Crystallibacter degradans]|uniref:cytochrome c biogenesis protein ResB n=1 Tax=Crystallibacter degradans TaxID=2726743 RepID=UPI0014735042|nr:cytochrome c biogenesis protein ResB [Arthrobacter sp. SF27]NMR32398.1 cytochrome c biogenesis protein ResB [Arthrobacter sp. SF27]